MQRFVALSLGCLLVLPGCMVRSAAVPEAASFTAQDVLRRMATTYAEATSYCDTGTVTTHYIGKSISFPDVQQFQTAFIRPDRFRFAITPETPLMDFPGIVWQSHDRIHTWWSHKPTAEKVESLGVAIATASSFYTAAQTIPALLLPSEVSGPRLTEIEDARRLDDAVLEGATCFRIGGTYNGWTTTIWVDQSHFLVRRIDSHLAFDTSRIEESTIYAPILGKRIPDTELAFNPPLSGQAEPGVGADSR